jgi:hypothetical protein
MKISKNNNPDAICCIIENMFSDQDIKVIGENLNSYDMKLLKNDREIYQTSIDSLRDTIIMTNSDQYMTATDQLENIKFSDLILKLTGKSFYLKGYPKSHNEKLILITISRYIEKLSYENGGKHYATFQDISRLDDEIGTYEIYDNLSDSVDDLNLYGTKTTEMLIIYSMILMQILT